MADTAFQTQYRQEFIRGFEQRQSLLRDTCTTEVQLKGNQAVFLVADSGGAEAVTRGTNGRIPGRPDNLNQKSCVLKEYHDKPERTEFNLFASQGDGRRIMQESSMAVMNRTIDDLIIAELATGTNNSGSAVAASLALVLKGKTALGNNHVPMDGQVSALITPAFEANLLKIDQFGSADYVAKKPLESGDSGWSDQPGYYNWMGIKFIVHTALPGIGTADEKCFMYHRSAIGHAAPSELLQTYAGYNEEHDFSFARCTSYQGAKLLQDSGLYIMAHDGTSV